MARFNQKNNDKAPNQADFPAFRMKEKEQLAAAALELQAFLPERFDLLRLAREGEPHELGHLRAQRGVDRAQLRLRGIGAHHARLMLARILLAHAVQTIPRAGEDSSVVAHALPPLSFFRILSRSS